MFNLFRCQPLAQIRAGEHVRCDVVYASHVLTRLHASKFNHSRQRLYHALVELNDLLGLPQQLRLLLLHHVAQPFSSLEQLHHRMNPPLHHIGDDRLADDVHHPHPISFFHGAAAGLGGDEEHRDLPQKLFAAEHPQHLYAAHTGHKHIQQHGAYPIPVGMQVSKPIFAVFRLGNGVIGRKYIF